MADAQTPREIAGGRIELRPPHSSMRGRRVRPRNMDAMPGVSREHLECVERIVMGIFADMMNGERSMTETLVTVYLSGAQHAIAVSQETNNGQR